MKLERPEKQFTVENFPATPVFWDWLILLILGRLRQEWTTQKYSLRKQ